jgi:hypothetical protein
MTVHKRRDIMAEVGQAREDTSIEKAVWHYVGVGVLWLALFLTGMAFERLGLTSGLFTSVFPGETGALRTQAAEYKSKLQNTERSLDEMMRAKQALEVEVSKLKKAAPAAQ